MQRSGDCQHVRGAQKRSRQWHAVDEYVGPDYLDGDCTGRDIITVLKAVKFTNGQAVVQMDKAARDYILCAVATRCGGK